MTLKKCNLENREDLITAYLSRQLSAKDAEQFEQHLLQCDECSKEVEFQSNLKSALPHRYRRPPPENKK